MLKNFTDAILEELKNKKKCGSTGCGTKESKATPFKPDELSNSGE